MSRPHAQCGFTMIEMLVVLLLLSFVVVSLAGLSVQMSRMNVSQQLRAEVQANARNTVAVIVERLRSAGWDPVPIGFAPLIPDPDPLDGKDQIEIVADLDADGATTGAGEQVMIAHIGTQLVWRTSAAGSVEVFAVDITNDADGDGTVEPMFTLTPPTDPTRVSVRVTARSPRPDPTTGEFIRYTVETDVAIRIEDGL